MRKMSSESGTDMAPVSWHFVAAENSVTKLRNSPRPDVKNPLGILMAAYVVMLQPPMLPGDVEEALVFRLAHDALLVDPDDVVAWALVRRIIAMAPEEEIIGSVRNMGYPVD